MQLEQQLMWNAEDAFDEDVAKMVGIVSAAAHDHGIALQGWVHELSYCPESCIAADGRCVLNSTLWSHISDKYDRFWQALPGIDGVVLTLTETAFDVTKDSSVVSDLLPAERLRSLVRTVHNASPPGKELIIRSFVHTPEEHQLMDEVLGGLTQEMDLTIMAKAHPTDWLTYYPYNAYFDQWIGTSATGVQLLMEIDIGAEMYGQNQFPFSQVEFVGNLVRQAAVFNASGVVARVERSCIPGEVAETRGSCVMGQPATTIFDTVNEITLAALSATVRDTSVTAATIYDGWATAHFGAAAAPYARRALELSFEAVTRGFFPLRQWFSHQHSNIPAWGYVDTCLDPEGYAAQMNWSPSPTEQIFNRQVRAPSPGELAITVAELDLADKLAANALNALALGETHFPMGLYADLKSGFEFMATVVRAIGNVGRVVSGVNCLAAAVVDPSSALPGELVLVREQIENRLNEIEALDGMNLPWPLNARGGRAVNFVTETRSRLAATAP